MNDDALLDSLSHLYTGVVCDGLDALGFRQHSVGGGIRAPLPRRMGFRLARL